MERSGDDVLKSEGVASICSGTTSWHQATAGAATRARIGDAARGGSTTWRGFRDRALL